MYNPMCNIHGANLPEALHAATGMMGSVFWHVEYGWCVIDGWGVDDEVHEEVIDGLLLFYTKTLRRSPTKAVNCYQRYAVMRECIARSPEPPINEQRRYAHMPLTRYCVKCGEVEQYLPDKNTSSVSTTHASKAAS
jgi:hypothetical protein